jgi:HAD superfamily hydrolase (TIGR01509 family)
MIFTTKAEYGVRLLIQLGLLGETGPVSLKAVAAAENLPLAYLERIAALLKKAGLVEATRGAHGGYVLGRPAEEGPALVDRLYEIMEGQLRLQVQGRPGAIELVERLRGRVPMALASNSSRQLVSTALTTAGLTDAFDAIITADDVAAAKPAPDVYLLACERLGVSPEDSLALEDSPSGIAAAKAAGLACIAVPQFAETDVSEADRVIDSLEDLLAET